MRRPKKFGTIFLLVLTLLSVFDNECSGLGASLLGLVCTTRESEIFGIPNFRGLLITNELYILVARPTALVPFSK